jgi:A-factor biosynthesis hotdog domain
MDASSLLSQDHHIHHARAESHSTALLDAAPGRPAADLVDSDTAARTITCALAHVVRDENLLVRQVWFTGEPHVFGSRFLVSGQHPYLYENPAIANHVSGTTFVDLGRQLLKAIGHLYYRIPLDSRFVLHAINMECQRWVKLDTPIDVRVALAADRAGRRDARQSFTARLAFSQEGHPVVEATARFTSLSAALEAKLMARQYAQPPEVDWPQTAAT